MGSNFKERPILFSGPMVKALQVGRKTQTRRVLQNRHLSGTGWQVPNGNADPTAINANLARFCPYGAPGDRLWVRETWAYTGQASLNYGPMAQRRQGYVTYAADGAKVTHYFPDGPMLPSPPQTLPTRRADEDEFDFAERTSDYYRAYFRRMRPSIHMPRWASRLTLEVTEVRVQRLQEISEADILAEGIPPDARGWEWLGVLPPPPAERDGPVAGWQWLWDSINGERPGCSWGDNPWVWAITFKKLTR
jgi:hypothetical protein